MTRIMIMVVAAASMLVTGWGLPTAAVAQGEASAPGTASIEDDYRIGPEDVLQIQVWTRADISGQVAVDYEGRIRLPLVGEVQAAGRTADALAQALTQRYQLLDPSVPEVHVGVSEYNSRSVTVLGEVRQPGKHGFRHIPDLWAVILAAGGATPNADLAGVQIVREEAEASGSRTIDIDLSGGIEATRSSELPQLKPQDTVIVPASDEEAVTGDRVQVLGAVRTPGIYRLSRAGRVSEALAVSGGTLENANLKAISLTRRTATGVVAFEIDLHGYLYEGRPMADLVLKPGDTITVPAERSLLGSVVDRLIRLAPLASVAVSLSLLL